MSCVVRGGFPDRQFDVDFWQAQGDQAIFDAAREMLRATAEVKGSYLDVAPDFKSFLLSLNQNQAKYLVIGDFAVMKYTEPLFTRQFDIWIELSGENTRAFLVTNALFCIPKSGVNIMLTFEGSTFNGMAFDDAWKERVEARWGDAVLPVISLRHLIRIKEANDGDIDRIHLARLRKYGKA